MTTCSTLPAIEGESIGLSLSDPLDRTSPFAVAELPPTTDLPDTDIEQAFERFCTFYAHNNAVLKRAKSAREIVTARAERIRILSAQEVTVQGTSTYRIRCDDAQGVFCTCRDYWVAKRQQEHGGACKHIIAVEILRMAAAAGNALSKAKERSALAFISLSCALFAGMLASVVAQTIQITIDNDQLVLCPGGTLEGSDGDGYATIQLDMHAITALRQALQAPTLDQVQLFLDTVEHTLTLSAPACYAQVTGFSLQ